MLIVCFFQVLFFVDYDSLAPIKEKFAIYADKFDPFAQESNAMSQYLGMFFFSYFLSSSFWGFESEANYQQSGSPWNPKASVPTCSTTAPWWMSRSPRPGTCLRPGSWMPSWSLVCPLRSPRISRLRPSRTASRFLVNKSPNGDFSNIPGFLDYDYNRVNIFPRILIPA